MGLFDYFTVKTSGPNTKRLTDAEAEQVKEDFDDNYKSEAEKRKALSSTGTDKVPTQSKAAGRSSSEGGATYYTTEISPTDLVPNPDEILSSQTPDFYRNGQQLVTVRTNQYGEEITTREWKPVPLLVADRTEPMLTSIRLIDTKSVPQKDNRKDPGKRLVPEFSKFFLTSVQEGHQEQYQTVETFNDWYVFFYGEKPPVYNFSGYLLNLANYNWWNEFMYYYQNFWRGTKAVELGGKIYITYNYQQVQGYILNVNTNLQAVTDKAAPFSISMLVTKRKIFNGIKDDNLIRDNLLPNYGLFDTNASATTFVQQLATTYLKGDAPAKQNKPITDQNISAANTTVNNSAQSTVPQTTTRIGQDQFVYGRSQGRSLADSARRSLDGTFRDVS